MKRGRELKVRALEAKLSALESEIEKTPINDRISLLSQYKTAIRQYNSYSKTPYSPARNRETYSHTHE